MAFVWDMQRPPFLNATANEATKLTRTWALDSNLVPHRGQTIPCADALVVLYSSRLLQGAGISIFVSIF